MDGLSMTISGGQDGQMHASGRGVSDLRPRRHEHGFGGDWGDWAARAALLSLWGYGRY